MIDLCFGFVFLWMCGGILVDFLAEFAHEDFALRDVLDEGGVYVHDGI